MKGLRGGGGGGGWSAYYVKSLDISLVLQCFSHQIGALCKESGLDDYLHAERQPFSAQLITNKPGLKL